MRKTPEKMGVQYQMTVLHNAVRSRLQLRVNVSTPLVSTEKAQQARCMSQPLLSPAEKRHDPVVKIKSSKALLPAEAVEISNILEDLH